MKRFLILSFSAGLAFAFSFLLSAPDARAQKYGNLSKKEAREIIKRVELESDIFRRSLDNFLDDSPVDGSDRETRYNDRMKEFEKAVDDTKRHFDTGDRYQEGRARIEELIRAANPVNEIMRNEDFNEALQHRWKNIRKDINRLAKNYDLARLPN
ncbi:MAG TPA: hypothetical protein VF599_00495 [Pyrinomonadaceae bacterium]|jgi:hypothetical protein